MKKSGFTLLELAIVVGLLVLLTGAIIFIYITCFRVWNSGEDRSSMRTELSQSIEWMTRDLHRATSVVLTSADSLLFTVDGDPYRFCLYDNGDSTYDLIKKNSGSAGCEAGRRLAHGVQTGVFSLTGNLVGIDLTGVRNGISVHLQTSVRPRNL